MIQEGERLRGFDVNTLTVIARESYEEFAENLQREIEADTGIRFGIIEPHQFARIPVTADGEDSATLGFGKSQALYDHLRAEGYIDAGGRIQDSLREATRDGSLFLPEQFAEQRLDIESILRKRAGRLDIKNADERRTVRPRQVVFDNECGKAHFRALQVRENHARYEVAASVDQLLARSVAS